MKFLLLLPLLAMAARAQVPSSLNDLEVFPRIDTINHVITAEVSNQGQKTAVAVALTWIQFDAADQQIARTTTIQDGVYAYTYPDYPEIGSQIAAQQLIRPGKTSQREKLIANPNAVRVEAQVAAVVWDDRTAQGDEHTIRGIFNSRIAQAKALDQALELLTTSGSLDEAKTALAKAQIHTGAVASILRGEHRTDAVAMIKTQCEILKVHSQRAQ